MSTKRPPLLSDADLMYGPYALTEDVRDYYEAARAKDAELIQMLVNALYGLQFEIGGIIVSYRRADKALDAAADAGFKPSEQ